MVIILELFIIIFLLVTCVRWSDKNRSLHVRMARATLELNSGDKYRYWFNSKNELRKVDKIGRQK